MTPYEWALAEMKKDIKEIIGSGHNKRIVWYHSFTTLKATDDETPWCSSFMCACAEINGFKSTRSAWARSWATYGVEGDGSVGDIVVLTRGNGGHVGFVHQKYKKGDKYISVLGGNQSNTINVQKYPSERLLAFRRFA